MDGKHPWRVLPHGPLVRLADNLWRVEGALPHGPLPRAMAVVALGDGALLLWSPICLDEVRMRELLELGRIRYLVVPNGWHRLDTPAYKARFPDAVVLCPSGARARVERRVPVGGACDNSKLRAGRIVLEVVRGTGARECLARVKSSDGTTLLFGDVLFNLPHRPGLSGCVLRLLGSSGGPKVPPLARLFLVRDRSALASQFGLLSRTTDLVRLVPCHGAVVRDDPRHVLARIAASLR